MTLKGNREKYWKKNPLKTMKYGDSIADCTAARAATYEGLKEYVEESSVTT